MHRSAKGASTRPRASFNIRSFGSWNASNYNRPHAKRLPTVSISALSDRGMHPSAMATVSPMPSSFNIRSFGSWNASKVELSVKAPKALFQYPLFRIVECIHPKAPCVLSSECVSISALSDRGMHHAGRPTGFDYARCFNIRSFGSWNASTFSRISQQCTLAVSISALSDRGMHPTYPAAEPSIGRCFNIRSVGSWNAS